MAKEKMVHIPERIWGEIVKLALMYDMCDDSELMDQLDKVRKGVYDKYDRWAEHDLYTVYQKDPDPAHREKARREYLKRRGIPEDFIWPERYNA